MPDYLISLIAQLGLISLLVLVLKITGRVKINPRWCFISTLVFIVHTIALHQGELLLPLDLFFEGMNWNWSGKIISIFWWVLVLIILKYSYSSFKASDVGLTLKQNEGSFKLAFIVLIAFNLLCLPLFYFCTNCEKFDIETLMFQATMPGFDEEPMFRGVFLYCLSTAVISRKYNFFGAPINTAGLLTSLLFGLVHGLFYENGELNISVGAAGITAIFSLFFLWLREKTGSLVFPIIAHNSVNTFGLLIRGF